VGDCVSAILTAVAKHEGEPGMAVYNLGTDESIVVDESIGVICGQLGVQPVLEHTGGTRGWAGDSPLIHLDTTKIRALGWEPTVNIRDAVIRTLEWLDANPTIVEEAR
jgi:UDP-glucose 4-epimerase